MIRKQAETELATMFRHFGYYVHKWRDRGFISCPHCGQVIYSCPKCHQSMLMPKADTKPDYLVAMDYVYVEAKWAKERFPFSDISPTQRIVMDEHESWLFIVIGTGRVPVGREAYLIPWKAFKLYEAELIKANILSLGFKHARNPSMNESFGSYQLVWVAKEGWKIPDSHIFWSEHDRPIHTANTSTQQEGSPTLGY